jgi:hypothetical protein
MNTRVLDRKNAKNSSTADLSFENADMLYKYPLGTQTLVDLILLRYNISLIVALENFEFRPLSHNSRCFGKQQFAHR